MDKPKYAAIGRFIYRRAESNRALRRKVLIENIGFLRSPSSVKEIKIMMYGPGRFLTRGAESLFE